MTEKELQLIYTSIMKDDYQGANDLIDSHYLSRSIILENLKKYVSAKSIEEQEKYKEKYELFLAGYYDYFKIVMSLINELEETGSINFDKYPSISRIKLHLNKFRKKFTNYNNKIEMIRQEIVKYQQQLKESEKDKLIDTVFFNITAEKSVYEREFYLVATSEYPTLAFRRLDWNEKTFYHKLSLFKQKYPEGRDNGLAEKFEIWFKQYLKEITKEQIKVDFEYRKDNINLAEAVLEDLIASGKSIYEYCHTHLEYNVQDIKECIKLIYGNKAEEMINKINKSEDKYFQQTIDFIAVQIMGDPNFTVVDYYLSTKLSLQDFYSRTNFKTAEVGSFVGRNNVKSHYRRNMPTQIFSKERELKTTRIIREQLITQEIKLAIFKFLEENQIPVDQYTYRACLTKYTNNDLDFVQKINTYKGSF